MEKLELTDRDDHAGASMTAGSLVKWFLVMLIISAGVLFACSLVGRISLRWDWSLWSEPIWRLRVFRLLGAAAVGMALAAGGMALQGLMRNPLAEPYILGISSGAGVGVLVGSLLGPVAAMPLWVATPALAMIGAAVTSAVVYGIAQRRGRLDPYVLLLAGVIVNVFNGALGLAMLQLLRPAEILRYVSWSMGAIPDLWHRPGLLILCWSAVVFGWVFLLVRSSGLNLLGLGEEVAVSSGVGVHRLRVETFIIVSLMTSAAVALAGPIGFVGLIVPHLCRMILGPDHRRLTIVSGFGGAMFLMIADSLCRVLGEFFKLGELPVGVVTAMVGGPFFIILLRRRLREGSA